MLRKATSRLLAGWCLALACVSSAVGGEISVWEAPPGGALEAGPDATWKALEKPGAIAGSAVVRNSRILMSCARWQAAAVVRGIAQKGAAGSQVTVTLMDAKGGPLAAEAVKLSKLTDDEAVLSIAFAGGAAATLKVAADKPFVEVKASGGATMLSVGAPARYVFRPDLFGTDVLFTPGMSVFHGKKRAPLPVGHYLLGVLSDDSAVVCTWPGADQKVALTLPARENGRRFAGMEIGLGGEGVEPVFVGLLEAPGVCRSVSLKEMEPRFAEANTVSLQPEWKAPFPARWYTLVYHGERKAASSLHQSVQAWPLVGKISGGKLRTWTKGGKMWTEDDRCHKPFRAAWYDGRRWKLDLEKSFQPFELALNYPLGRVKETPASAVTVIDVLRETLPGSWEKVLDIEGLKQRGAYKGDGRMVLATCAGHYELCKMAKDKGRQVKTRAQAKALERYLATYHARSQEYLAFAAKVRAACDSAVKRSPEAAALVDRLVPAAGEMDSEWKRLGADGGLDPAKWGLGMKKIYAIIDQWPEDTKAKLKPTRDLVVGPGSKYDSFVAIGRKVARHVHRIATVYSGGSEATLNLAEEVRDLSHEVLRRRYYKEEQLSESAWGPQPNPARLE